MGPMLLAGAGAALFLVHLSRLPPVVYGDGWEYLLMAESLHRHLSPEARPADLAALGEFAARWGLARSDLAVSWALAGYREAGGAQYSYHFWAYPAATLPARWALGPAREFVATNGLLYAAAVIAAGFLIPWPVWRRVLFAALLAASPAFAFLRWPHPEVFSFAGAVLAIVFMERRQYTPAILSASAASLQNPPLLLFVAYLLVRGLRERPRAALAVAAATAALPFLFYWAHFGVPSPLASEAARARNLSLKKAADLLLDFDLGLLPYAPVVVLGAIVRIVAARGLDRTVRLEISLVLAGMLWAATATENWNHATCGPSRYTVWLAPFLIYVLVAPPRNGAGNASAERLEAAALGVAVAVQAAILVARGGLAGTPDHLQHSYLARAVLDRWPSLYRSDPEVFAQRTAGRSLSYHRLSGDFVDADGAVVAEPFVYRADGRCRKALAQKRHQQDLVRLCGAVPPSAGVVFARGADKAAWRYVDY
ncbi:MAG TPA: hypothetical protein VGL15_09970 [Vicinamibacteria bacterium]